MTHPLRVLRYDNEPEAITRPDIVPAALRFAEHAAASELEPRSVRELAPYAPLPPVDELTVQYPALQRVPVEAASHAEEPPPSDVTAKRRSGTRRLAPTVPPPRREQREQREQLKHQSLANGGARPMTWATADSLRETAPRSQSHIPTVAAPPPPTLSKKSQVFLLFAVAVTAIAAAGLGASLGNGSLARGLEWLSSSPTEPLPLSTPVVTTMPVRPPATANAPSTPPASTSEAIPVPVVRLQDLPRVEQDPPASKRTRRSGKRR